MMAEEALTRFNRRTLTRRIPKLMRLTWNLAEVSTRIQKERMMIGSVYQLNPSFVQIGDDLKKRGVYVLKKDLWHSCQTKSCADGAIYVVSADTVFVTKQSQECREKVKELKRVEQRVLLTEVRSVGEKSHPRRQ